MVRGKIKSSSLLTLSNPPDLGCCEPSKLKRTRRGQTKGHSKENQLETTSTQRDDRNISYISGKKDKPYEEGSSIQAKH